MSAQLPFVQDAVDAFDKRFGGATSAYVGLAPGRVNLIGEYTDLNNGYALPMAIDLGVCVVLRPNDSGRAAAFSVAFDERVESSLHDIGSSDWPVWARYLAGVAELARERGCPVEGFDAVVNGNLPIGGGVSSSAALCVAMTMGLQAATTWSIDGLQAAKLCQLVEHRYAGVMCGIMDQLACRLGEPERAVFIDCASLHTARVPIRSEHACILIVDSGVPRALHESAYNARRNECIAAVEAIGAAGFDVADLRGVTLEMLAELEDALEPQLFRRCRHVVTENQRVLDALDALTANRMHDVGALMNLSHASLRDDFEVSVDELDHITDSANALEGVYGARLTGAGFGGNAIVLADPDQAQDVEAKIAEQFAARFGRTPPTHRIGRSLSAQGFSVADV